MRLPHIANFDDFDPLRYEPGVLVRFVAQASEFGYPDLIIIPGSKTTVLDLDWLREQRLSERILHARAGGIPVIGVCAGYQMARHSPLRPRWCGVTPAPYQRPWPAANNHHFSPGQGHSSSHRAKWCEATDSWLRAKSRSSPATKSTWALTSVEGLASPLLLESRSGQPTDSPEGALDDDGLTLGTYLHGLFHNRALRRSILEHVAARKGVSLPIASDDIDPNHRVRQAGGGRPPAPRYGLGIPHDQSGVVRVPSYPPASAAQTQANLGRHSIENNRD